MTVYTVAQMKALAVGAGVSSEPLAEGYSQADIAAAIGMAESGGKSDNIGDQNLVGPVKDAQGRPTGDTWEPSVGLWQIRCLRSQTNTGQTRDKNANLDPGHNAQAMFSISSHGTRWGDWTTYNDGAFRKFLPGGGGASASQYAGVTAGGDAGVAHNLNPLSDPIGAGVVGFHVLTDAAGTVLDAAGKPLAGLNAIGAFFGRLLVWDTWLRVLQIAAGLALLTAGALILSRDLIAPAAAAAVAA